MRDESEAAWAADRVERDRNPGPLEPVHFAHLGDVPAGLAPMWLLPSVRAVVFPDQAAADLTADPSQDAPISCFNPLT